MGEGESAGSLLLSSMQIHSGNPQRIDTSVELDEVADVQCV